MAENFDIPRRSANFSEREVDLLLRLVKTYGSIIESKKTDGKTCRQKDAAWAQIAEQFNTCSIETIRPVKCLRQKYENFKKTVKKKQLTMMQNGHQNLKPACPHPAALAVVEGPLDGPLEGAVVAAYSGAEDGQASGHSEDPDDDWRVFRPIVLRRPATPPIVVIEEKVAKEEQDEEASDAEKHPSLEISSNEFSTETSFGYLEGSQGGKRKIDLASNAGEKCSKISEARLELINAQKKALEQDIMHKEQEHRMKMELMQKEWELKEKKLKLEIMLLQKKVHPDEAKPL